MSDHGAREARALAAVLRTDAPQPVHASGQAALRDFLARVGLPKMIAITTMLKAALSAR